MKLLVVAAVGVLGLSGASVIAAPIFMAGQMMSAAGQAAQGAATGAVLPSAQAIADIPAAALKDYQDAAQTCPGLDWTVLAGIGKIESDHGRSSLPGVHSGANFAGAMGPMQFLSSSWATWVRFANGAGLGALAQNVYDHRSASFAAAHYLCNAGAPGNIRAAVFSYNHLTSYVNDVLAKAAAYKADATQAAASAAQAVASRAAGVISAVIHAGNPFGGACRPARTQGFGPSALGVEPSVFGFLHFHTGFDLACPGGTPVHTVTDGVAHVTLSGVGYGNSVLVEVQTRLPGDASPQRYFVRYSHLQRVTVANGAAVHSGDIIGMEGSTGASTGPHLHFGLYKNGQAEGNTINPSPLLAGI